MITIGSNSLNSYIWLFYVEFFLKITNVLISEWVSSFLTAHRHILGYLVPYNDVEDTASVYRGGGFEFKHWTVMAQSKNTRWGLAPVWCLYGRNYSPIFTPWEKLCLICFVTWLLAKYCKNTGLFYQLDCKHTW